MRNAISRSLLAWTVVGFALPGTGVPSAHAAATTMVDLGAASPYTVLSGASVANTVSAPGAPHTTVRGDLGIKADVAPSGFPPGTVTGTIRKGSSVDPAHAQAVSAYNAIANRPDGVVIPGTLVGAVLPPGLYTIAGAASNTGTLTLDGGGDASAVFVFQVNGALSFAAASHVVLTNGARASRVFWQVNGAGAIGAAADFAGTLLAKDAVGIGNGTLVNGRAFALNGALTLDNNQFYGPAPVVTIDGGGTGYTTDTTPTIFGTTDLDAPGQVTVTIAGQTLLATPINGNWSVTAAILANGVYSVEAAGTDAAGNPSIAIQQLTVDTLPPAITLDGGSAATTRSTTPILSGTTNVEANTVVRVTIGSQNLTALVQADDSWNVRATLLADGTYSVTAAVSDPAGNETIATQTLRIDTRPVIDDESPFIASLSLAPKQVRLKGAEESALNKLGPKIRISLTEKSTVEFRITRKSFFATTFQVQRQGGASFIRIPKRILKSLTPGTYRITAVATDSIGQTSAPRRASLKVLP